MLRIDPSDSLPRFARLNYFSEVTLVLMEIRDQACSGRLSIRNCERVGLVHLYFKEARLVHVAGDKRDTEAVLHDLLSWSKGQVRFDPAVTVEYVDVSWRQGEIFTRWVSLLEMHGLAHGIPTSRLRGLTRQLTTHLPQKPIALPSAVEQHEERRDVLSSHLSGEGIQHFLERAVPEEQRVRIRHLSLSTMQHVGEVMLQAGRFTQELTRRATKLTHEKALRAVGFMYDTAKHAALHTEEVITETQVKEQRQSISSAPPAEPPAEAIAEQATHRLVVPAQSTRVPSSPSLLPGKIEEP
jgi:hypothetical protein